MAKLRIYSTSLVLTSIFLALILGCATSRIIGGPLKSDSLKEGVFEGEAQDGLVNVLAEVTIQNKRITNIKLLEHRTWKGKEAENIIPSRIIEQQSTKVDVVSGATISSNAIMNAVENAVRKAK